MPSLLTRTRAAAAAAEEEEEEEAEEEEAVDVAEAVEEGAAEVAEEGAAVEAVSRHSLRKQVTTISRQIRPRSSGITHLKALWPQV